MRKIIVLLLVAGAWFAGYLSSSVYGAPARINLDKFGEEMLRADRWSSEWEETVSNIRGAKVSLATDLKAGKCLKIDYKGENYFVYAVAPTDFSEYEKIQFMMKGDGSNTACVFQLKDKNNNTWGYGPFFIKDTKWVTMEAMLNFPSWGENLPLDKKNIIGIQFYENGGGEKREEPSTIYLADFKVVKKEGSVSVKPGDLSLKLPSINSNGNMVVDGKPFFPLSIYSTIGTNAGEVSVAAVPGWFKDLKKAGFNMVHSYTVHSKENYKTWLDSAQEAGLKVMACTYPLILETPLPVEPAAREAEIAKKKEVLKAHIETVRDHPAMGVYNITDECFQANIPKEQVQIFYDYIRSLDTVHPTLAVESNGPGLPLYRKATDIFGIDIYPIGKAYPADITSISNFLDRAINVQIGTPPKPVLWAVLQIFKPDEARRFPTEGEMRAMTFLALTKDVKGLHFFIYNWPNFTLPYSQSQPEHWQHVSNAINSVHTVFPALFSEKTVTGYAVSSDKIYSIGKEVAEGGKKYLYLLAVHPSDGKKLAAPLTITFKDLPQINSAAVQVLDEDAAGTFKLGSIRTMEASLSGFTDTFGENAVHVYKISIK